MLWLSYLLKTARLFFRGGVLRVRVTRRCILSATPVVPDAGQDIFLYGPLLVGLAQYWPTGRTRRSQWNEHAFQFFASCLSVARQSSRREPVRFIGDITTDLNRAFREISDLKKRAR